MNRFVLSVSRCLIPAFATACLATASQAQQGPPGGLNVNVVNTPLAVTGSVTTSGSVSLAPGSSVSVINNAQNPVPVRVIEEPFQANAPGTISSGVTFPAVPAGKRLVIEHLSVRLNNEATAVGPDTCVLNSNNISFDYFALQPVASNALNHVFAASVQTKFYFEAGTTPLIFCGFLPGAGASGSIQAFISGYFTPLP